MDPDAALQPSECLGDLMVKYASAVGGAEEEPLHPVESSVCLEDHPAVLS